MNIQGTYIHREFAALATFMVIPDSFKEVAPFSILFMPSNVHKELNTVNKALNQQDAGFYILDFGHLWEPFCQSMPHIIRFVITDDDTFRAFVQKDIMDSFYHSLCYALNRVFAENGINWKLKKLESPGG